MKITHTNGNAKNRIRGSRISIWTDNGVLIDRFEVRTMYESAEEYCKRHPGGKHGQRYARAIQEAQNA